MHSLFKIAIICLSFAAVPVICFARQPDFEKIFYMSQLKEKDGIKSLQKNADSIDILAPQFFSVTDKMKIKGKLDAQLEEVIKQKKIKVMPLIINTDFKQDIVHKLLTSPADQDRIINGLVYIAKKNNYIGWQFDFENIYYLDRDSYSAFVEKAARALKKKGLILSVAVVSRSVDYENTNAFKNWGGAYDYKRLARAADFISLMTYDDPDSVGPVASLPFIKKVLNYVKDKIPREKLSFGVPLYNWSWSKDPFKRVAAGGTHNGLQHIKYNFSHNLGFDAALGASWLTYFYNNKQYQVWYQDKKSFESSLDIVKKNSFRGFSAWVLGIEDPNIWGAL